MTDPPIDIKYALNYHLDSYLQFSFLCKRVPSIKMQENGGFCKIYNTAHKYGFISLYQTLLAYASGSLENNVNIPMGTGLLDSFNDSKSSNFYPNDSQTDSRGRVTGNYCQTVGITKYFKDYFGKELLESNQDELFGVGLCQPTANPEFERDYLDSFHVAIKRLKLDYRIINLQKDLLWPAESIDNMAEDAINIKKTPQLLLIPCTTILSSKIQQKLEIYVKNGGIVAIFDELLTIDEDFKQISLLREYFPSLLPPRNNYTFKHRSQPSNVMRYKKVGKGILMYQPGNPFLRPRGPLYFFTDLIARSYWFVRSRIPGKGLKNRNPISYAELVEKIGNSVFGNLGWNYHLVKPPSGTVISVNKLLRFLQQQNIHRQIDVQVSTINKYRHKVDLFLYIHPKKDVQHIFLFSLQCPKNLPINITYFLPDLNRRVRIKSILVGYTAQLFRIENGELTAIIYSGVNPINHLSTALDIEINDKRFWTDAPVDIFYFKGSSITQEGDEVIFSHNQQPEKNHLHGLVSGDILLKRRK